MESTHWGAGADHGRDVFVQFHTYSIPCCSTSLCNGSWATGRVDGNPSCVWLGLSTGAKRCQPCWDGRGSARPGPKTGPLADGGYGSLFLPSIHLSIPPRIDCGERDHVFSGQQPKAELSSLFWTLLRPRQSARRSPLLTYWLAGPLDKRPTGGADRQPLPKPAAFRSIVKSHARAN